MNKQDRLVQAVTAFSSWQDMLRSLRGGYVPTLRSSKQGQKLARVVRAAGFKVYQFGQVW